MYVIVYFINNIESYSVKIHFFIYFTFNESEFILVRIFYLFAIEFFYALWMCQIIMTVYVWDKRSDYTYFWIWRVLYCATSVFILCTCILIVVNAILAAVKQVVLFVLYIDDGQDLGADLIMGIQYLVVLSNRHAIIWGRIDTSHKFNIDNYIIQVPCFRKWTYYRT